MLAHPVYSRRLGQAPAPVQAPATPGATTTPAGTPARTGGLRLGIPGNLLVATGGGALVGFIAGLVLPKITKKVKPSCCLKWTGAGIGAAGGLAGQLVLMGVRML